MFEVPELNRNAKTVGRLDTGQKIVLILPSILLQLTTPRAMLPITLGSLVDTKTDSTDHKPTSGFMGDNYGTVQVLDAEFRWVNLRVSRQSDTQCARQ